MWIVDVANCKRPCWGILQGYLLGSWRLGRSKRRLCVCLSGYGFTTLSVLCAVVAVDAQVNIEDLRANSSSPGFRGRLELDLSARTGNTETQELGMSGRLDHMGLSTRTFVVGRVELGWEGGERFSNEALAHLRRVHRVTGRWNPEGFIQVNYDKSRLLDFRWLVGGGLRLGLYRAGATAIHLGVAYMFEHERLGTPVTASHDRRTSVHRSSNYLSINSELKEGVELTWTVYTQPRLRRLDDFRMLSETRFSVDVASRLSLASMARLHYDSKPPDGTKKLDTLITSGVSISF